MITNRKLFATNITALPESVNTLNWACSVYFERCWNVTVNLGIELKLSGHVQNCHYSFEI
jgi:hypothetical protein